MDRSLVNDAKAIKNSVELEGMRQCHLRDAAALCHYFAWLEDQLSQGKQLSEVEAADYLENLRRQQKDFVGLSFDTISSTGANGAIIHYKPEPETCKIIDPKLIYLCDSGGQYRDGTTDVTRTYHFGQPNDYEKRCFTRVLQGHIAIDRCVFPLGTTGNIYIIRSRHGLIYLGDRLTYVICRLPPRPLCQTCFVERRFRFPSWNRSRCWCLFECA